MLWWREPSLREQNDKAPALLLARITVVVAI
jgi:hypothetical protein